ncbi:AFG1/ZapE family ATPase, partial [Candidatus Pelagibacter sp.]|nr:AFG1/ZapE family ATPase [Candidatus Pelagibacter sp.]
TLRFDFNDLCAKNIGAEDYIKIADSSTFMVIENIPNFNNDNSNQQQRFVTLIDILYEKKIPLLVSSKSQLDSITSSNNLRDVFKRTISRLHELTSTNYNLR